MATSSLPGPTLLDLIDIIYEFAESPEEGAAVVNYLLRSGRVRLGGRLPGPDEPADS